MVLYSFYIFDRHSKPHRPNIAHLLTVTLQRNAFIRGDGHNDPSLAVPKRPARSPAPA